MKPLLILAALAVASTLPAASAQADYRACMEFCTKERGFVECNTACRETPRAAPAKAKPIEICKLTDREQWDIIVKWLFKNYDIDSFYYGGLTLDENQTVELKFRPENQECMGAIRLTGDCRVVRHKKFNCKYTGWTRKEEEQRKQRNALVKLYAARAEAAILKHVHSNFPDWRIRPDSVRFGGVNWDVVPHLISMNFTRVRKNRADSAVCDVLAILSTNNYHVEERIHSSGCND